MSSTLISDWLISHCIFQFLSKTDISMHPNGQWIIHSPGGRDEDEINDRVNWSIYHFTPGLSRLCSTQLNCQFLQTQHWYFLFVWKLSTINPDKLAVTTQQTAGSEWHLTGHTMTELPQNLDEMNFYKSTDHKKYGWAATGCGVRIKL